MSNPVDYSVLVANTKDYVKKYMSKNNDDSHYYVHVERVVSLAQKILKAEQAQHPEIPYKSTVVTLGALMHDVGDHQHQDLGEEGPADHPSSIVSSTLVSLGATPHLGRYVQKVVRNVSYFYEPLNPGHVKSVLSTHPELAIVQDADRLDALGVIGIGRKFTRFGVKGGKGTLQAVVDDFEKLYKLEGTIKTNEGKRIARIRVERLKVFAKWWAEEQEVVNELED